MAANNMTNTVSVVMATYNGAKYIKEQLDSIINQTYPVYELIIQDDCSTDNTVEILEKYARNYSYIHIKRNEHKKGINENFFSAMEEARGDYIAISDQDDIWELDKIENQITYIHNNCLCSGFSKHFSDEKELYYDERIPNYKIERLIHLASALPGHTMLIKKSILPTMLKFRDCPILYDHLISLICGSYNKITFVDKVLVNHRSHQTSATFTVNVMNSSEKGNRTVYNIVKSIFRTIFIYIEIKGKMRDWFAMIHQILQSLPQEHSANEDALKIALYQSQKGLIAYLKLTFLYVRLRERIFHFEERNTILSILRAIYFPISCSDYFRYMSKSYKK